MIRIYEYVSGYVRSVGVQSDFQYLFSSMCYVLSLSHTYVFFFLSFFAAVCVLLFVYLFVLLPVDRWIDIQVGKEVAHEKKNEQGNTNKQMIAITKTDHISLPLRNVGNMIPNSLAITANAT